jgi:hypothetical protein
MAEVERHESLNIPSWALGALINGDFENLSKKDIQHILDFQKMWDALVVTSGGLGWSLSCAGDAYFSEYPMFGEAGMCEEGTVIVLK